MAKSPCSFNENLGLLATATSTQVILALHFHYPGRDMLFWVEAFYEAVIIGKLPFGGGTTTVVRSGLILLKYRLVNYLL
jgi:hypothetical protein